MGPWLFFVTNGCGAALLAEKFFREKHTNQGTSWSPKHEALVFFCALFLPKLGDVPVFLRFAHEVDKKEQIQCRLTKNADLNQYDCDPRCRLSHGKPSSFFFCAI